MKEIHAYENPKNKFERAMTVLSDTAAGRETAYHSREILSRCNMDDKESIIQLQGTYDSIVKNRGEDFTDAISDICLKLLKKLTEYKFPKLNKKLAKGAAASEDNDNETMSARLYILSDLDKAIRVLEVNDVDVDLDSGGRIMLYPSELRKALEILDEKGIDYEEI